MRKDGGMTHWESVVEQYGNLVWVTAYRLLGDRDDAADCFQEAFLTALKISRRQKVRSWGALLTRLVTCRAIDRLRRNIRRTNRFDASPDLTLVESRNPTPSQELQATELAARLRHTLTLLPPLQAEVFSLRYVSELSYGDIARELKMKKSAVGVLLHRARRRLKKLLESDLVDPVREVSG